MDIYQSSQVYSVAHSNSVHGERAHCPSASASSRVIILVQAAAGRHGGGLVVARCVAFWLRVDAGRVLIKHAVGRNEGSNTHSSLMTLAIIVNASSTFVDSFADVSMNGIDNASANSYAR